MRRPAILLILPFLIGFPTGARADLTVERADGAIQVRGDGFRLVADPTRRGDVVKAELYDGSQWQTALGPQEAACPNLRIVEGTASGEIVSFRPGLVRDFAASPSRAAWKVVSLDGPNEAASGWKLVQECEVYAEGAVFFTWELTRLGDACDIDEITVECRLADSAVQAPKYRQGAFARPKTVFPAGRVAFGLNPSRGFTNEIAVMVERKEAIGTAADFVERPGRFVWRLAAKPTTIPKGFCYRNRMALGFAGSPAGQSGRKVLAERVYHWINYLDRSATDKWFPTDRQIDQMADNGATMLILHQDWMRQSGSNGNPHADYETVRHEAALRRTIKKTHERGLRVGFYRRGIEPYGVGKFFPKYLTKNLDGMYVDWHGPHAVAEHEMKHSADPTMKDVHFSDDGSVLPARDYFLLSKRLREIVGADGFLIGHMGFGNAGIFPNLGFDAFLPGEHADDHRMFHNRDDAVWRGMQASVTCMPWPLDSPHFTTREGVAKMAAWGFFPHVGLGLARSRDKTLFPLDPDAPPNRFPLEYWRVLSALDSTHLRAYNLPSQGVASLEFSNPVFEGVAYEAATQSGRKVLLVVANLSEQAAESSVTVAEDLLPEGEKVVVRRVDARDGTLHVHAMNGRRIEISRLGPWGITGFLIEAAE